MIVTAFRTAAAAFLLLFCAAAPLQAEPVHLSAALGMKDALNDMMAKYSAAHPAAQIQPNFAAAGVLAKQIEQGAPADIFIAANQDWVSYLAERKLVALDSKTILASNQLVFISALNPLDFSLEQIAAMKRVAIGNPQTVPGGQYAKQVLERIGIYAKMELEKKFVLASDVRQALLYADQEMADGAFVYKTTRCWRKRLRCS